MEKFFKDDQDIDFTREFLCKSFEGRQLDLITLTKKNKILTEQETLYGD